MFGDCYGYRSKPCKSWAYKKAQIIILDVIDEFRLLQDSTNIQLNYQKGRGPALLFSMLKSR